MIDSRSQLLRLTLSVNAVSTALSGAALLPFMGVSSEGEGPRDQLAVDVRVVGRDVRDQLINELLMLFLSLKDGHISSVLRVFSAPSPVSGAVPKGEESPFR